MEEELREILIHDAKRKNICIDGFKRVLSSNDKHELLDYYKSIIDWSLERDFPPIDVVRRYFSDSESDDVFVDRVFHGETFSSSQIYVFHACQGTINVAMDYDNEIIPMLYFANNCHITIRCEQENLRPIRVPLYIFGDNTIVATNDDNVEFIKFTSSVKR
jgi:hypothetical protein